MDITPDDFQQQIGTMLKVAVFHNFSVFEAVLRDLIQQTE
jgi:hypothetical protein